MLQSNQFVYCSPISERASLCLKIVISCFLVVYDITVQHFLIKCVSKRQVLQNINLCLRNLEPIQTLKRCQVLHFEPIRNKIIQVAWQCHIFQQCLAQFLLLLKQLLKQFQALKKNMLNLVKNNNEVLDRNQELSFI